MLKSAHGYALEYIKTASTSEIHPKIPDHLELINAPKNKFVSKFFSFFSGASIWNSLPQHIQNLNTVKHFKRQYIK